MLSGRAPGGPFGAEPDPALLPAAVAALDADVVALQEVDRHQARSGDIDQTASIVAGLGLDGTGRFLPTLIGTPGLVRSWRPASGPPAAGPDDDPSPAYGIALVTRLEVVAWHELRFGRWWGRMPMLLPTPRGRVAPILVPDEPRGALAVVVRTPAGPLTVVGTHLSFLPLRAVQQLRTLTRWAATLPGPRVLLGDLNLPGAVPARLSGWSRLAQQPTFPAEAPRVQLDHALGHGFAPGWAYDLTGRDVHTVPAAISDHRALVVDLSLR